LNKQPSGAYLTRYSSRRKQEYQWLSIQRRLNIRKAILENFLQQVALDLNECFDRGDHACRSMMDEYDEGVLGGGIGAGRLKYLPLVVGIQSLMDSFVQIACVLIHFCIPSE